MFSLNPIYIPTVHMYSLSKPNIIIAHEQKYLPLYALPVYFVVYVTLKIAFHQALSILLLLLVAHGCLYPAWLGGHSLYSINISIVHIATSTFPQIHPQTTCYYSI